jgi:hypothetical protein
MSLLPEGQAGSRYVAAYRKWLGLEPFPVRDTAPTRKGLHKATAADSDLTAPVEPVVLSVKENTARCRLLGSQRVLTLRATRLWKVAQAEIVVVQPRGQWSYAGHRTFRARSPRRGSTWGRYGWSRSPSETRACGTPRKSTGAKWASRSTSGPTRSSIGEFRDGAYRVTRPILEAWGGLSCRDGYLQWSAVLPSFTDAPRFLRWFERQGPELVSANNP